jgi:hypothetical protein
VKTHAELVYNHRDDPAHDHQMDPEEAIHCLDLYATYYDSQHPECWAAVFADRSVYFASNGGDEWYSSLDDWLADNNFESLAAAGYDS